MIIRIDILFESSSTTLLIDLDIDIQSLKNKNDAIIDTGISKKFKNCVISSGKNPKNTEVKNAIKNMINTFICLINCTVINKRNIDIENPRTNPLKAKFSSRNNNKLSYVSKICSLECIFQK